MATGTGGGGGIGFDAAGAALRAANILFGAEEDEFVADLVVVGVSVVSNSAKSSSNLIRSPGFVPFEPLDALFDPVVDGDTLTGCKSSSLGTT